jgi:hypothetical protein
MKPGYTDPTTTMRAGRSLAGLCLGGALLLAAVTDGSAHREAPPTAQTGAFGETTCQSCHFQAPVNQGTGTLAITGVPEKFIENHSYTITVTLLHAGVAAAGFQLSVRFPDGTQAGSLTVPTAEQQRIAVTTDARIQYGHHLYGGTLPVARDTARWTLTWTAPAGSADVVFHAVATAGNDDESPLGDWVYAATCGPGTSCQF